MTDASVADALRSAAALVVVEAPAGCGKTHQGADYARDVATQINRGRVLILTHTHAACDVFAARTQGVSSRVEIRTIDSLISQVAGIYHLPLGLPPDAGAWARAKLDGTGYSELAARVARLMRSAPMVPEVLAQRYPIIVCDEHQDASADQHAIVMALHAAGSHVRIFGDPMQRIYGGRKAAEIAADQKRWSDLKAMADAFEELDFPHRWSGNRDTLGQWILAARTSLKSSQAVDLRTGLPSGVQVFFAENLAQRPGGYQVSKAHGDPIYTHVRNAGAALILGRRNETVGSLRSFFFRSIPIWEGHTRDAFASLAVSIQTYSGNAPALARAVTVFMGGVAVGFSPTAYGNALVSEVESGCTTNRRGKPALIQELARHLLQSPDHHGVARLLHRLGEMIESENAFRPVTIDHHREFSEASRLNRYGDANEAFAELAKRRTFARPKPPAKALSTIHKAKGLETSDVVVMPIDKAHFSNSEASRCLLYVAMSRATHSLTFVVSRNNPSPLLVL